MLERNRHYIVRTGNGVLFAHPLQPSDTIAVGQSATVAVGSAETVSDAVPTTVIPGQSATVAAGQPATVTAGEMLIKTSVKTDTAAFPSAPLVVADAIIHEFGLIDDDALQVLIRKCRQNAPDITDEEIARIGAITARAVRRRSNVRNHVAVLIEQAAKYCCGRPFEIIRKELAEERRRAEELERELQKYNDQSG
jgi:hypothetical protein